MKLKPFSFFKKKQTTDAPAFATGADGDLTILNGQTITIPAGSIRQYDNLDIQPGGTLQVTGDGPNLTQIVCRTSCNIGGQIVSRNVFNPYSISGTTISGLAYSHTVSQRNGGAGGRGEGTPNNPISNPTFCEGGQGGTGSLGGGGGGGGGGLSVGPEDSSYRVSLFAGNGGTPATFLIGQGKFLGNSPPNNSTGSVGGGLDWVGLAGNLNTGILNGQNAPKLYLVNSNPGNVSIKIGGDGAYNSSIAGGGSSGGSGGLGYSEGGKGTDYAISAGGGGGGFRGRHGGAVYVFFNGVITGSGIIDVSGDQGYNGGNGGQNTAPLQGGGSSAGFFSPAPAGGGGGGAGGSGGLAIVESGGDSLTLNVNGGNGGAGGVTNTAQFAGSFSITAQNGFTGQTGNAGQASKVVF